MIFSMRAKEGGEIDDWRRIFQDSLSKTGETEGCTPPESATSLIKLVGYG